MSARNDTGLERRKKVEPDNHRQRTLLPCKILFDDTLFLQLHIISHARTFVSNYFPFLWCFFLFCLFLRYSKHAGLSPACRQLPLSILRIFVDFQYIRVNCG